MSFCIFNQQRLCADGTQNTATFAKPETVGLNSHSALMNKAAPIIFIVLIATCAYLMRGKVPHARFDKHLWQAANLNLEENWSLRWDMMNDLRNRYKLVGMTKNEILALLGSPGYKINSEFSYYLGYSKTGINTGSLTITFNDQAVVTQVRVREG